MRIISGVHDDNWTALSVEIDFEGATSVDLFFYLPNSQEMPSSKRVIVAFDGKQQVYELKRGEVSAVGPIRHPIPYSKLNMASFKFDQMEIGIGNDVRELGARMISARIDGKETSL